MKGKQVAYASVADLLGKAPKEKDISVGGMSMKIKAIGAKEYDDLVAAHPPTAKQKKDGSSFNIDTFAPALLARCLVQPAVSEEEAEQLYGSPSWSAGEMGGLYVSCMRLCTEGLDVPTSADD